MPATPLHFLSIAFLNLKRPERFDLVAFFFASGVIDLEPLHLYLTGVVPDHQIWHSYLFVTTVYLAFVSVAVWIAENKFEGVIKKIFSVSQVDASHVKHAPRVIVLSVLIGGVSHVFFDMFTHKEMPYVIFPLLYGNPFWLGSWQILIDSLVVALSLYSVWIWWNIREKDSRHSRLLKVPMESEGE